MSLLTLEQSFADHNLSEQSPGPTSAEIGDAIQAPRNGMFHPTDEQLYDEANVETSPTNDEAISQESDISDAPQHLSLELILTDANAGPVQNEIPEAHLQINETSTAQLETEASEPPINDAILCTSVTTVSNECFEKFTKYKKRKKTWTQSDWFQKYVSHNKKSQEVLQHSPEFQVPDADSFHYGGQTIVLHVDDLSKFRLRTSGAFGSIFCGRIPGPPSVEIAAKLVPRSAVDEVKTLQLVAKGDHPNIVDYYCTLAKPGCDNMWICMECMCASLDDVNKVMHQLPNVTDEQIDRFLRRILRNCAEGLYYLELKGLAHRDIKPHNILINRECRVKLCDFGISISLEELKRETTQEKGTELYTPFERACGIQDDMWSLGVTLLEILDGKNPFASSHGGSAWNKHNFSPPISARISPEMQYCIFHLLQHDPRQRPKSYLDILMWDCIQSVPAEPLPEESQLIWDILEWIPSVVPDI